MSLSRNFFNDIHPLFRLVEDPQSSHYGSPAQRSNQQQRQAVVDVSEEEKEYVVRAELPGVQKKDVDVHIGNDGRSLTIEGHVHRTNKPAQGASGTFEKPKADEQSKAAEQPIETYDYRSTFSRTVWFPHAVDGNNTRANLADGILTLNLPKRMESGRQKINLQ
ncbi:HSP20-like chaperone [Rhizoctonia solani]|nr:HSP20-like chaperone [Rhizoctonia solani]